MVIDKHTLRPASNLNEIHDLVRKMSTALETCEERVRQLNMSYMSKNRALNDLVDIMHDRLCVIEEKGKEKKNKGEKE